MAEKKIFRIKLKEVEVDDNYKKNWYWPHVGRVFDCTGETKTEFKIDHENWWGFPPDWGPEQRLPLSIKKKDAVKITEAQYKTYLKEQEKKNKELEELMKNG